MPRGGIEHSEGESKVERVIRLAYEETKKRLVEALAPVEGDYRKLNDALIHVRNLVELLIGIRVGDHPVCGVNAPRDFFAQAGTVRSGEIKELVGGERLVALLAQYDEVSAVAVPLRAAIADVDRLMGKEPSEPVARAGRGTAGVESGDRVEKSILALIATRGSIRVSDGCAKKLGCDRTVLDRAIVGLLAEVKIKEIGGNDQSGRRYGFARSEDGRGGGGGANGAGKTEKVDGRALRAQRRRAEIRTAVFAESRTFDTFVISQAFCGKVGCAPETARSVLEQLIEEGIYTMEGSGPSRKYTITPKGRAEIRGGGAGRGALRA